MSVRVGLGLASFPFRNPASFFRWAELCEEKGVDSLWQSDRLVSHDDYLEAITAVAALAGVTERVRFGFVHVQGAEQPGLSAPHDDGYPATQV